MPGLRELAMHVLRPLNDLVHVPIIEYILYFLFTLLQLLLAPVHLLCFLLLGVVDVMSGYVWWTYDEATEDRPIVITGCSRGFGHDLALALDAAGWRVYAGCRSEKDMDCLRGKSKAQGGKLTPVMLDVTKDQHIEALRHTLEQECPRGIYALVNNAGYAVAAPVDWLSEEAFRHTMEVNFFGAVKMIKSLLPLLKIYGKGARIVQNSSTAGLVSGGPAMGAYGSSKHALESLSSTLRAELYGWGIHVAVLNPTSHRTPMLDSILQAMTQEYKKLPPHRQAEYGDDYLQGAVKALEACTAHGWDPRHVVKALIHATTGTQPRGQYLIGLDAKFVFPPLTQLPTRVIDYALGSFFSRLTPARLAKELQVKTQAPSQ